MQDVINGGGLLHFARNDRSAPGHGALAVLELANVALDELKVGPLLRGDQALHFVQVALVAGGEVVEADHALVKLEQGFEQVAADEAGHTGDEPGFWGLGELLQELFVSVHVKAFRLRRPGAGCFSRRRAQRRAGRRL